jgi:hypothetical protein
MGRLTTFLSLAALLPAAVAAAAPTLQNARFTEAPNGIPASWRIEAWNREYSEIGWEPAGNAGGAARITSRTPNDARLCQTVAVVPGGTYRVSARIKTADVGASTAGALIAVEPRIADSIDLKGTRDWETVYVTAENVDRDTLDVCLRLGSYANLNTGTAWFSDVRIEQIGGPTEGASWWSRVSVVPLLSAARRSSWLDIGLPVLGGVLLAYGLGIFGSGSRHGL